VHPTLGKLRGRKTYQGKEVSICLDDRVLDVNQICEFCS
jgi:hypothetical protein